MILSFAFTCLVLMENVFGSCGNKGWLNKEKHRRGQKHTEDKNDSNAYVANRLSNHLDKPNTNVPIQTQIHTYYNEYYSNPCTCPGISIIKKIDLSHDNCMKFNQSSLPLLIKEKEEFDSQNSSSSLLFYCVYCRLYFNTSTLYNIDNHNGSGDLTIKNLTDPNINPRNVPNNQNIIIFDPVGYGSIYIVDSVFYTPTIKHQILSLKYHTSLRLCEFCRPQSIQDKYSNSQQYLNQDMLSLEGCTGADPCLSINYHEFSAFQPQGDSTSDGSDQKGSGYPIPSLFPNLAQGEHESSLTTIPTISVEPESSNDTNKPNQAHPNENVIVKTILSQKLSSGLVYWSFGKKIETYEDQNKSFIHKKLLVEKINKYTKRNAGLVFFEISKDFFGEFSYTHSFRSLSSTTTHQLILRPDKDVFGNNEANFYKIMDDPKYNSLPNEPEKAIFMTFNPENESKENLIKRILAIENKKGEILKHIFKLDQYSVGNNRKFAMKSLRLIFVMWNQFFIPDICKINHGNLYLEKKLHANITITFGYYTPNEKSNCNDENTQALNSKIKTQSLSRSFICRPKEIYLSILKNLGEIFEIPYLPREDQKYVNLEKYFFFMRNDNVSKNNDIIFRIFSKNSCLLGLNLTINNLSRVVIYSCYIEFICTFNSMSPGISNN